MSIGRDGSRRTQLAIHKIKWLAARRRPTKFLLYISTFHLKISLVSPAPGQVGPSLKAEMGRDWGADRDRDSNSRIPGPPSSAVVRAMVRAYGTARGTERASTTWSTVWLRNLPFFGAISRGSATSVCSEITTWQDFFYHGTTHGHGWWHLILYWACANSVTGIF